LGTFLHFLATGFYIGYLPMAPGTWATLLLGIPLCLALKQLGEGVYWICTAAALLLSVLSSGFVERSLEEKDPSFVVIDEIVGFLFTMIHVPPSLATLVCACGLFRLFDILKPPPIRKLEQKLPGGWGITLDDVLAGFYANLTIQILIFLLARRHP